MIQHEARGENADFMTDSVKASGSAEVLTAEALRPKTITRVGFWNVRTLYQTGKLAQLRSEFDAYNLDLVGISEMVGFQQKDVQGRLQA